MRLFLRDLVVDEALSLIADYKIDIVVMGTHGASGITELILGSNTASVIEKAPVPVLAIPANAVYTGINNVVYAYDEIKSGLPSFQRLLAICRRYLILKLLCFILLILKTIQLK